MRLRPFLSLAVLGLTAGAAAGFVLEARETRDGARLFDQVLTLVNERFVDSVETGQLYEKAARGLVEELNDPYSELLAPKDLNDFTTRTGGRYGGVGMLIEQQQENIVVSRVYPNTPAEEAGAREGDRIIEVDGQSTRGWKTAQVSERMQGTPGTKVAVKFARHGYADPIAFTFTRRQILIPAIPYTLSFDGGIGYIPLQTFNGTASDELARHLGELKRQGLKGVVLDLRSNPGGFLEEGLAVSNLFLRKGQEIASVRGRGQPDQRYAALNDPVLPETPMVILTDAYSASASEIVAGALQDHDRALVLGSTSFGKGLVQTVYRLDDGYALKITTGKWYTPSGRSIQKERKVGADGRFTEEPDTVVRDDRKERPVFKSDGGRLVYGGGAITPDVIVPLDTLTTAEREFLKKVGTKAQDLYVTVADYAVELKDAGVSPGFTVTPAWRDELWRRLVARKLDQAVTRAEYDAARPYIDRFLANRVSRLAFGEAATKRRELADDGQLTKALDILRKGSTQKDLFTLAAAYAAAPAKD